MASITKSASVPASTEAVWAIAGTPKRFGDWQLIHAGFDAEPPAAPAVGDTFKQKVSIMGMPGEVVWTVATLDPERRLALEGKGPMGTTATAVISLAASGDETTVTYETGFEGAALKAMEGALEKQSAEAVEGSLQKLRELLA